MRRPASSWLDVSGRTEAMTGFVRDDALTRFRPSDVVGFEMMCRAVHSGFC